MQVRPNLQGLPEAHVVGKQDPSPQAFLGDFLHPRHPFTLMRPKLNAGLEEGRRFHLQLPKLDALGQIQIRFVVLNDNGHQRSRPFPNWIVLIELTLTKGHQFLRFSQRHKHPFYLHDSIPALSASPITAFNWAKSSSVSNLIRRGISALPWAISGSHSLPTSSIPTALAPQTPPTLSRALKTH